MTKLLLNYGNCNFFSGCNPFNNCMKIHFTTLRSVVNLRILFDCLIITIFESLSPIHLTALKIYVQLTQFPSIILRIINPSVHDGLSRYQINFPSVKSQRRPHCLSEDWPARHRVYQQIEHSTRNYAHYAPRVARARERRHYTRKRIISVIISISAVPEISSSRSRYFRSVPCGGMRSEASATDDGAARRGSPRFDSLRVPSRRCLFYLIIIANGCA